MWIRNPNDLIAELRGAAHVLNFGAVCWRIPCFPCILPASREFAPETSSLVTVSSSGESDANSRRRSGANTAGCRAAAAWFPSGPFDIGTCRGSLRIRRHRGPRSISGLAVLDSAPNEAQTMSDDRDGSRQSAQTTKQRRKGTSPLAWAGDDAAAPARRNGLGPWTDRRGSWPPAK